jgi:hypothetical protein
MKTGKINRAEPCDDGGIIRSISRSIGRCQPPSPLVEALGCPEVCWTVFPAIQTKTYRRLSEHQVCRPK